MSNSSYPFNSVSQADGGSVNRTIVLDSNNQLNISGSVGTLDIGTIRAYAPDCSSMPNGVARLNNGRI